MQVILQCPPVCQALFFVLGSILGANMQAFAVLFTRQAKTLENAEASTRALSS